MLRLVGFGLVGLAATLSPSRRAVTRALPGCAVVAWTGPRPSLAAENADAASLRAGLAELESLVDNWETRTLNCKYAEVNRELLAAQQKSALLEQVSDLRFS